MKPVASKHPRCVIHIRKSARALSRSRLRLPRRPPSLFAPATQSFKPNSSMGRPTGDEVPSFAPFEREVVGRQVCSKIAVSNTVFDKTDCSAGAGGFEPPHGGIKIRQKQRKKFINNSKYRPRTYVHVAFKSIHKPLMSMHFIFVQFLPCDMNATWKA